MRRWHPILVVWATLAVAPPAEAQIFRYMAFGDSITTGNSTFDPTGQGGYPGRLDNLLGCFPPDCEVVNEGKDGERTSAGISRLNGLLDNEGPWDIVLLMEGTNDVFAGISNNTIEANLATMDTNAANRGVDTLHASIVHLDPGSTAGQNGSMVSQVASLRGRISNLAASRNRWFADPWTPLCPDQACFDQHYHDPPGAVGHPDPSGFDILAETFEAEIVSESIPGLVTALGPTGTVNDPSPPFVWDKEPSGTATFYQLRVLDGATPLFNDWVEENDVCNSSQCTINTDDFPDGSYTWEVRGRNPRDRGSWRSTPFTIDTLAPPTAPEPVAPIGVIGDAEPVFEWDREDELSATRYQLFVSDGIDTVLDERFATEEVCTGTSCTVDPFDGKPLVEGEYTWRVRGLNTAGDGAWSADQVFYFDPNLIFLDGFESGDTSAWSTTLP